MFISDLLKHSKNPVMVAHACSLSFLGDWDKRVTQVYQFETSLGNIVKTFSLKKKRKETKAKVKEPLS